jgi:uncharacterized repeat protein (TIGR03803 family)
MSRLRLFAGFLCGLMALAFSGNVQAVEFQRLYAFKGGNDGIHPSGSLVLDEQGNLYGLTNAGGGNGCGGNGCGTAFKISADGMETVLHAFAGGTDGANPLGGLIADQAGNFYGTTSSGGGTACGGGGCGTVFKLTADGTETVLHAFAGGADGATPAAGLVTDGESFYGTTQAGGSNLCGGNGCGTIFAVGPDGSESILHAFAGSDGSFPVAKLLLNNGILYGTTEFGGSDRCSGSGCGTVFQLPASGRLHLLHRFKSLKDGAYPVAGLIVDGLGNFFGVTQHGGKFFCPCGTIFKISPSRQHTTLFAFRRWERDGIHPSSELILDNGNLIGTTTERGNKRCGCGGVFELLKNGEPLDPRKIRGDLIHLHRFLHRHEGIAPGALMLHGTELYGVTWSGGLKACGGGMGCGVVFKLSGVTERAAALSAPRP